MAENKPKLTKDQLVKIKEHISEQLKVLKEMCEQESKKVQVMYQTIPLWEQQLKVAEEQIKNFKEEDTPKKS